MTDRLTQKLDELAAAMDGADAAVIASRAARVLRATPEQITRAAVMAAQGAKDGN